MHNDDDIIDVEFETVTTASNAKSARPRPAAPKRAPIPDMDKDQLGVFDKSAAPAPKRTMPLPLFIFLGCLLPALAFYLAGGHALLGEHTMVQKAEGQSFQPLELRDISTETVDGNGRRFMKITARIHNKDKVAHALPSVIVRFDEGTENARMFRIKRSETLNPGESLIFTNSLPLGDGMVNAPILSFSDF